tara:strand:+ start:2004 stop:3203 length:1200 start_codon:yes stop_codon:yes gene_type:complete
MENINNNNFDFYNLINKYLKYKLLILSTTFFLIIIVVVQITLQPQTYRASINIGENNDFEFSLNAGLSKYFKENNIKPKLFVNNFLTTINSFDTYEKLAIEIKTAYNKGKFKSISELSIYEIAKYLYASIESIESNKYNYISHEIYFTSSKLSVNEVKIILGKLVSLALEENRIDLKNEIDTKIEYLDYQIDIMKIDHNIAIDKKESDLMLKINKLIIELNYANSQSIKNLDEQILLAKNLGFEYSQLGDIDRANQIVQDALVGKLPQNQILNLPLYLFGSKILEEELKQFESNYVTFETLGKYGGAMLLADLETIDEQRKDIFINGLNTSKNIKNELLSFFSAADTDIFLKYDLEQLSVKELKKYNLIKWISSAIILSLLLNTFYILYREEHIARSSR